MLCPYLRATWPLGMVGMWSRAGVGWMSPPSDPTDGNCELQPGSPGWPCVVINCSVLAFDLLMVYGVIMILGFRGVARVASILFQLVAIAGELIKVFFRLLQQLVSKVVYGVKYIENEQHHHDFTKEPPPSYTATAPNTGPITA